MEDVQVNVGDKDFGSDDGLGQVNRLLALLVYAEYPGDAMWRYQITCDLLTRGALACAKNDVPDMASEAWLAAAIKILEMEYSFGFDNRHTFSPKEQTKIATMFLPVANALIDWVDAIRKRDAIDQECDWQSIMCVPETPEYAIFSKLGDSEDRPNIGRLKSVLFKENERCEIVYNPLLFKQIAHGLEIEEDAIDFDEPRANMDIQECNVVISELYKYRAIREGRMGEKVPSLSGKSFQEIFDDLSGINDEHVEQIQQERAKQDFEIDEMGNQLDAEMFSPIFNNFKQKRTIMYDVFISHAHADKKLIVESLVKRLRELNISVWYDTNKIKWGDNIAEQINYGLDTCRFGIVIISPEFLGRNWTEFELSTLLQKQNERGKKVVLPLLYKLSVKKMVKLYPELKNIQAQCINGKRDINDIVITFAGILINDLKSREKHLNE